MTFPRTTLRQAAAVIAAGVLALVGACGGGGGDAASDAGTPTATASSYSQGPIAGFGSVIVNGIRWDDSDASVTDDDGTAHSHDELKLGMVVEVDGGAVTRSGTAGSGKAIAFRFGSAALGPITSIDITASTMVVLGLTVQVTTSTVFDSTISGGLAGLAPGDIVEIHGLFDAANGRVVATRVEPKASATEYRLRGTVASLDTTAKTFLLGDQLVSYAGTAGVPSTLANGVQVKVRLQTTQTAGAWVANAVRVILRDMPKDRPDAEVEGVITAWTSANSFTVNGIAVDASKATFPDGSAGVVLGAHVEVKGAVSDGVLVATSVALEDDGGRHGGHGAARQFELHGLISNLDTTAKSFSLRGLTVSYDDSVTFKDGTATNLANGTKVEVKGTLSSDLTKIVATEIDFEQH